MNHQLSFLDVQETQYGTKVETKAMSRRSDPVTSKLAAESVASGLSETERLFVQTLMSFGYPATAQEVADRAYRIESIDQVKVVLNKRETLRKRAGELEKPKFDSEGRKVRDAWIKVVGTRDGGSGREAQTYEVI